MYKELSMKETNHFHVNNKKIGVYMMKKLIVASTFTIGLVTLAACGDDSETVVESDIGDITKEDFYDELVDSTGENVLQEMITQKVLEDKYEVDDEEVDKELEDAKEQLGDQFDMWLMQEGYGDEDEFRKMIKTSLLYEEAVYGDVEVEDEEIEDRYERMKEEIEAEHILVEDEETAKEVKKKLEDDGDFAELAKEYSVDEGSAENGGKLDYFSAGQMVPEFEDAAYSLDVDEISDPVESDHGFHIIRVLDKRDAEEDIGSLEDNEDEIRNELRQQKVDPMEANQILEDLIEDANIDIKIEDFEDMFEVEG